tara:strand:+ start:1391 stop:2122 length:732 start_codon:yes stop_codon:yes gene_type:complete
MTNTKKILTGNFSPSVTVSIHQPNYIPWLGFFDKVMNSDIYVVFDDVQYPRGKDFANRNQIKTNNGKLWLTIPIKDKSSLKLWKDIQYIDNGWKAKHLKNIESFYKKSDYFETYYPKLENIFSKNNDSLMELNVDLIKFVLEEFAMGSGQPKIVYSSDIKTDKTGLEKILHILSELNATHYISGSGEGSNRYIDEEKFTDNNIKLVWQEYTHPEYKQLHGEFIPYLSILDLLFNEGKKGARIV